MTLDVNEAAVLKKLQIVKVMILFLHHHKKLNTINEYVFLLQG